MSLRGRQQVRALCRYRSTPRGSARRSGTRTATLMEERSMAVFSRCSMVCVFPEPVCPYMNSAPTRPASAPATAGAAAVSNLALPHFRQRRATRRRRCASRTCASGPRRIWQLWITTVARGAARPPRSRRRTRDGHAVELAASLLVRKGDACARTLHPPGGTRSIERVRARSNAGSVPGRVRAGLGRPLVPPPLHRRRERFSAFMRRDSACRTSAASVSRRPRQPRSSSPQRPRRPPAAVGRSGFGAGARRGRGGGGVDVPHDVAGVERGPARGFRGDLRS